MKIARKLFETHGMNLSSYATILTPYVVSRLESSLQEFSSTSSSRVYALANFIDHLSKGHARSIVKSCKRQCRIRKAPPFCNSWEIVLEKMYVRETLVDIEIASKSTANDFQVELDFKIQGSMLVYQEVPILSPDNFVGQLGGLIGLYVGWSFLSCATFVLAKLVAFIQKNT